MKYKTIKALAAAYKNGELSKKCPLWLDNDTAFVYDENEKEVFRSDEPPEAEILDQCLTLLGIPSRGV